MTLIHQVCNKTIITEHCRMPDAGVPCHVDVLRLSLGNQQTTSSENRTVGGSSSYGAFIMSIDTKVHLMVSLVAQSPSDGKHA